MSEVAVTYINIILYAVSYQLQRPVEPFLVRSLIHERRQSDDANSNTTEESTANQTYGRLTSFFSLIQTVGSPLVGILLDRIGPRRTSILVYGASACSYAILQRANTTTLLYLSKVPTLLQHAFLVSQATVASLPDESGREEDSSARRAAALGRLTTAYTLGATIGPALGGHLAKNDLYAGARLAVWGSLVSVLLSVWFLRDHSKKYKDDATVQDETDISTTQQTQSFLKSVKKTLSFLRHPTIGPLLFIKLLNGVSSSTFSTALPLILANKLFFSTAQLGYFMSASSISVACFAAVAISPAMALVNNRPDRLAAIGLGCRLLSIIMFGVSVTWAISTLVVESIQDEDSTLSTRILAATTLASVGVSLSSHMHATSLTTLTTATVSAEERGAIIGLEHGIFAMARIVGPPLGTTLLSRGSSAAEGLWRVILVCSLMELVLVVTLKVWSARWCTKIEPISDCTHATLEEHDHSD
jgi:OCT family organic cation transporter-like MFS transporter 18